MRILKHFSKTNLGQKLTGFLFYFITVSILLKISATTTAIPPLYYNIEKNKYVIITTLTYHY